MGSERGRADPGVMYDTGRRRIKRPFVAPAKCGGHAAPGVKPGQGKAVGWRRAVWLAARSGRQFGLRVGGIETDRLLDTAKAVFQIPGLAGVLCVNFAHRGR